MGFFQSIFQPHREDKGCKPASIDSRPKESSVTSSPVSSRPQSPNSVHSSSIPKSQHPHNTPRFQINSDGSHSHHLSFHPSRISLNGLTNFLGRNPSKPFHLPLLGDKKMSPDEVREERAAVDATLNRIASSSCLAQKWGTCHEVIGKGAFGIVRVAHKTDPSSPGGKNEQLYAVKEFRKRSSETTKDYVKRLTSEFCISSSLHQRNVIETLDLVPLSETSLVYCQVMEYCGGGDLFNLIYDTSHGLETAETYCFFKQLVRGIQYIHSMGIAHRDIKPENLILTSTGCLKITDFGNAECFRATTLKNDEQGEHECTVYYYSKGLCGSEPYIAPEEFEKKEYDPRCVDVWSAAVTFMAMKTSNHMWNMAKKDDENFERYLKFRRLLDEERGLDVFEGLEIGAKRLMYRMLDPNPNKRITIDEVAKSDWFSGITCCQQP
ncbi:kinase-like domain-containing protein [Phycomyces blakesleeanus]|uniref:non-specific serine/threonine protein kinase n=2 Tax=Phycomyces blakesleeanus TaxID=4837 RepID=A0ABR3BDK1_PHYBL